MELTSKRPEAEGHLRALLPWPDERLGADGLQDAVEEASDQPTLFEAAKRVYELSGSLEFQDQKIPAYKLKNPDKLDLSKPKEEAWAEAIAKDVRVYRRHNETELTQWLIAQYTEVDERSREAAQSVVPYVLDRLARATDRHFERLADQWINLKQGSTGWADCLLTELPSGQDRRQVLGIEMLLAVAFSHEPDLIQPLSRAASRNDWLDLRKVVQESPLAELTYGRKWVYALTFSNDFMDDEITADGIYFGMTSCGVRRLFCHVEKGVNKITRAAMARNIERGEPPLTMKVIVNLPPDTPASALLGIESVVISCSGSYGPHRQMQYNAVGGSTTPGIPVRYVRTTYLRYVEAMRLSGTKKRFDVPTLDCFRPSWLADTPERCDIYNKALEWYTELLGDLATSASASVKELIRAVFFAHGFNRNLTSAVSAVYPLHPLGHAKVISGKRVQAGYRHSGLEGLPQEANARRLLAVAASGGRDSKRNTGGVAGSMKARGGLSEEEFASRVHAASIALGRIVQEAKLGGKDHYSSVEDGYQFWKQPNGLRNKPMEWSSGFADGVAKSQIVPEILEPPRFDPCAQVICSPRSSTSTPMASLHEPNGTAKTSAIIEDDAIDIDTFMADTTELEEELKQSTDASQITILLQ